jgi:large subunit ribosomal protein L32
MRSTGSHTGNRRAHHALKKGVFAKCPKCSKSKLPHAICMNCGTYKGREMVNVMKKHDKKAKKQKAAAKK